MIRKWSVLLAMLIGMAVLGACEDTRANTNAVDATDESCTQCDSMCVIPNNNTQQSVSHNVSPNVTSKNSNANINTPPENDYIPLEYSLYIEPTTKFPNSAEWELYSKNEYENVLGFDNVLIKKYNELVYTKRSNDRIAIVVDSETNKIIICGYDLYLCDIDYDGIYEIYGFIIDSSGQREYFMWLYRNNEIVCTSLSKGIASYLGVNSSKIYYKFAIDGHNYIQYEFQGESDREYYESRLYVVPSDEGLIITGIELNHYSPYVSFESSDNDIYRTEIKFDYDDTTASYTLYLYHGKYRYAYTNDELKYEPSSALVYERRIIVHPSLPYAALVYPLQREFANETNTSAVAIISLINGQIIDRYSYHTVTANYSEKVDQLLADLDSDGLTTHYMNSDVKPNDTGFDIYWSIMDNFGNFIIEPFLQMLFQWDVCLKAYVLTNVFLIIFNQSIGIFHCYMIQLVCNRFGG